MQHTTLWDQPQIGEIYIIRRTRMIDSANFEPPFSITRKSCLFGEAGPRIAKDFEWEYQPQMQRRRSISRQGANDLCTMIKQHVTFYQSRGHDAFVALDPKAIADLDAGIQGLRETGRIRPSPSVILLFSQASPLLQFSCNRSSR